MKPGLYRAFNNPTSLVLLLLSLFSLMGGWFYTQQMPGIDYYVAWTVADAVHDDTVYDVYTKEGRYRLGRSARATVLAENPESRQAAAAQHRTLLEITSTPFLFWVVNLVSTGDYERDLTLWHAILLLSFAAGILLIGRLLGFSMSANLVILLSCLMWMSAFLSDLRVANINSLQLALVALALWLQSRDSKPAFGFAAGSLVAMLVMLKPNLAPIALLLLGAWLIRGETRKLLTGLSGMAAGTVFAFAVSSYFFGAMGAWLGWLGQLSNITQSAVAVESGNYNYLRSMGFDFGAVGQVIAALVLCATALGFMWWGRKACEQDIESSPEAREQHEFFETAQLVGLACLVQMLVSPMVWLHYYVLAVPMLMVAFRPWSRPPERDWFNIILYRLLPAVVLFAFLDGPYWRLVENNIDAIRSTAMTIAVLILFALGSLQLRFRDPYLTRSG